MAIWSVNCMYWHASELRTECRSLVGGSKVFHCSLYYHSALVALTLPAARPTSLTKSLSFFDPLCTSIYSLKGNKGCVVIIIVWRQVEDAVRKWWTFVLFFLFVFYPLSCMTCFTRVGTQTKKIISWWFFRPTCFLLSAFGLLQSAFQILIVHSSGLKKVLFSKG